MTASRSTQKVIADDPDLHLRILNDVAQDLSGEVVFPTSLDLAIKIYLFYRASQYSEYRDDPQLLIELVLGWHEAIGESVLSALGFPEKLIEAVRDHDYPRIMDREPHNLNDIVYVANLLAGSNWEWLPHSLTPAQIQAIENTRQRYAFLLPEVASEIQDMYAALGDSESPS